MNWAVNNLAGSLAGTHQAARVAKRDVDRKEPAKARRARDEFDQTAEPGEVEHAEAVRSLKDNSQEEAHEDRQEHGGRDFAQPTLPPGGDRPATYGPGRVAPRGTVRATPRVDLEG